MTNSPEEKQRQAAAHRFAAAKRSRENSESIADIGQLPDVVDPDRREACQLDLQRFLETYFPNSTGLKPFSSDHERVIDRIERCVLHGGRFCNAVYRGFAKTTISENAAIWATIYGHRSFVVVFGGDQASADGVIDSIKRELDSNDLLNDDFPEVCYAIRCLEGKPQRQHSQSHAGELTHLRWTADTVVLPTIAGSAAAGGVLSARGLTGSSRGLKFKRPDGTQQRPDFVIIDDPQTDESAESPLQVAKRLKIIQKSILKLAGHNKSLAVVMNATVISPDDLIDQILDPKRNAAWQGERIKMVKTWSNYHDDLWLGEYASIRNTYDGSDPESQRVAHQNATEFYRGRQLDMDSGCQVSWAHCYDSETEISAIQHAYNALIDDGPEVFASEFQNEPERRQSAVGVLSADAIVRKINAYSRRVVPLEATKLTAFVDVQKDLLFWLVVAWSDNFNGFVLDYGTHPEQNRLTFTAKDARLTLLDLYPDLGFEARLFAGLNDLGAILLGHDWRREDGAQLRIERQLIDANWGDSTKTVYQYCKQSPHSQILLPSHGMFVRASGRGLNASKLRDGERRGDNWRIPPLEAGKATRHAIFDANYFKSFIHKRLITQPGSPGCLTLFQATPREHAMLASHLVAELPTAVTANGRTVDEWQVRPGRPDNHWLDCLVGCAVGASIQGVALNCHRIKVIKKRKRSREASY